MQINFTKMHGLGNDFVVIDGVNQKFSFASARIKALADRHFGIGFDQLLIVENVAAGSDADFSYRIFNADGNEVAQCGNGARCFAHFVLAKQLTDKNLIKVDTHAGQLSLKTNQNGLISVDMGIPNHNPKSIPLHSEQEKKFYTAIIDGVTREFAAVQLGNPHAVLQVQDINSVPVATLGSKLQKHSIFPEQANIGFMQLIDRQQIKLRVYERGANETLACGSGACAAVIIGIEQGLLDNKVKVKLRGGELEISWLGRGKSVFMTGPVATVFDGIIKI